MSYFAFKMHTVILFAVFCTKYRIWAGP